MAEQSQDAHQDIRYEPDERPPLLLTLGLGFQYTLLHVASIVMTPLMMITLAGGSEAYLSWAIFSALVICGVSTALQAVRVGRVGAGYVLLMGTSGAFLAVCVSALEQGGPGLLASLIVISSLGQFVLAMKLSLFRRVFTPTVVGTMLMLIPVTLGSLFLGKLTDVPPDASPVAAPVTAGVTLVILAVLSLQKAGMWRLWAPIIGVGVGSMVGGLVFGLYDTTRLLEAAWIGSPTVAWPGFDLSFGPHFWALLPAFLLVTLVGALRTIGHSIAIQQVSWRRPRAIDFRAIQGALAANGIGNILSRFAGTVPNTTSAPGISITTITRVAARPVGICVGILFILLAFFPKCIAVVVAVPGPVLAAYFSVILAVLFITGIRMLFQDGLDYRKGFVVGLAFWLGLSFQMDWIFPNYIQGAWNDLLGNGMTVGGCTVIILLLCMDVMSTRRDRLKTAVQAAAAPQIDTFLVDFATRLGWNADMTHRVRAVGEETLLTLLRREEKGKAHGGRRLLVIARGDHETAELEFIAATEETNLEDQVALLADRAGSVPAEEELSLRLLQHHASSVRHQQYHDTDVVTVRVEPAVS